MAKSLKVLVAGSGPIIIGQAAEFDYSGSQCCAALREEGHSVVLVNSNPATIQTDPETADTVYIEPLNVATLERIIEKERPDAIMPGMGGQTGLNLTTELAEAGVLEKYGVQPLGTSLDSIAMAEDREKFRQHMVELGEPVPQSAVAESLEEAIALGKQLGYPAVVRPAYTLGGTGGGIAHSPKELEVIAGRGLAFSPTTQVLIEESVLGWQEFEFEVLRDCGDDAVIICSMENLDAMGVHTGESIVVAPALTLPDVHYQRLRTSALKVVRGLGIIGGCNFQFAFEPASGDYVLIEVNPRVSRSSALASKATGVPIARIATLLALGRRLHELPNLVTGNTSAAFEPALDYIVLKIPRWPFDKFKFAERDIGTQMKSTGETMAIGRSFEEALLKGWRSLGQGCGFPEGIPERKAKLETLLRQPNDRRLEAIWEALRQGLKAEEVAQLTGFHTFFTKRIGMLVALEAELAEAGLMPDLLVRARKMGFGDAHIAHVCDLPEVKVREARIAAGLRGSYLMVDTCAGEFAARTPYFYSTCSDAGSTIERGRSVIILGSGPIRIGQGIEFDYSTVHGVQAVR
ncbi:MAG: carbamoyl-phosphate synthase large subunit, partial [Candidatus Poseidoniia archaeon]|nr:carbamoyl-phosphate synthase large subunit [Candidatus Poseidoniia archaeon]